MARDLPALERPGQRELDSLAGTPRLAIRAYLGRISEASTLLLREDGALDMPRLVEAWQAYWRKDGHLAAEGFLGSVILAANRCIAKVESRLNCRAYAVASWMPRRAHKALGLKGPADL